MFQQLAESPQISSCINSDIHRLMKLDEANEFDEISVDDKPVSS